MNRTVALVAAVVGLLVMPAAAVAGHGLEAMLDHPSAPFVQTAPPSPSFTSGGPGAKWEPVASIPAGNPHSDLDFFTRGGNTFMSAGVLGTGPNSGGQQIFQLTDGDKVTPKFVGAFPSASCLSNPAETLSLQHDVEATPKGNAILNTDVLAAARSDAQLMLDATDAPGRCHDQGVSGIANAPQGGLEIVDISNPAMPVAIGLTSHIGEAHTVNVDPKRPHIAYAVTSDSVGVNAENKRLNENNDSSDEYDLDGFEVINLASCMNFPAGTTLGQKRAACRPQVFRYRYPTTAMSQGHTLKTAVTGCHELEVYPDDRLTCGSGNALITLNTKGAFDDRGTPSNFRDDVPRGTALPCQVRPSSSAAFRTNAMVTDCVDGTGTGTEDLAVPEWIAGGSPSLAGVDWIGSAFHQGRGSGGAVNPTFDSTQDIDFNHEAEYSNSGRYILATDERGGGVAPPGATCSPAADQKAGNGGVHAYRVDRLLRRAPTSANDAFTSYARTSRGDKAIYRAPIRTGPQGSLCTAHVFQQIPGQNRIFMGWYSQGTQVIDFTENRNGTLDFKEAGYYIPASANQWTSHVFKVVNNQNGFFTYYGAATDFSLGAAGRNTIDIYKVTLPAPPAPRGRLAGTGEGFAPPSCLARRVRVGNRNIGRLKLRQTRARTARRARPLGARITRKQRVLRYCVKGPNRKVRGAAVFDRKRKTRVVMSNARGHKRKKIGAGSSRKALRRKFGNRLRKIGPGLRIVRGSRKARNRVVFKITKTRVRYVALTDRKLAKKPKTLRAYLRRAKLR